MPLILGFRNPGVHIIGVEIQAELARLADQNIAQNQMTDQICILNRDIKEVRLSHTQGRLDLIISNPPYKKKDTGRLNLDSQRAVARHEITVTIEQVFASADMLLKPKGRIMVIFPADRIQDLLHAMAGTGIQLDWLKYIHTRPGKDAKRVILSGVKGNRVFSRVLPPLILYDEENNPTKTHTDLFNP